MSLLIDMRRLIIACLAGACMVTLLPACKQQHDAKSPAALSGEDAKQPSAPRRPNVLVILVDDLGWPDVSVYGRKTVPTPNIESIAASGAAFTNGYVVASVCAVSRAGLLTGRTPQRFGFEYNISDDDRDEHANYGLPVTERTIADRLKALGYHTGAIGKWHQGFAPEFYPTKRGFDEFYGFLSGETLHADVDTPGIVTTPVKNDKTMKRKATWQTVTGPDATPVDNHRIYLTEDFTHHAVEFIDRHAQDQNPFFLYLGYLAPHWPMQVPQSYYDRFATIEDPIRRTYVAMIAALDDGIGRVLEALDDKGIRDDTLIVFISDNGCPVQFGFCDCSHPLGAGKFTYVEGGTRVPFVMSWPAGMKPQGLVDTPVSTLDVLPTVLRAAAPDQPLPQLEGKDLVATATGAADPARVLVWGQDPVFAVRDGKWKLWKSLDQSKTRLFDLEADPGETQDVSASQPQVMVKLEQELAQWRAGNVPPLWPRRVTAPVRMCTTETERVY